MKKNPVRIIKIKLFFNKYDWEGIYYSSEKDYWKKIEQNNLTVALNVFYAKKGKIHPVFVSKLDSNRKREVIVLMIPNGEG